MTSNKPNDATLRWAENSRPLLRRGGPTAEYHAMGITQAEVRRWLTTVRRVDVPPRGVLPRAAYEAFLRAHPERDTRT